MNSIICFGNCELLSYSHVNGSMNSAQLQLLSSVLDLVQCYRVAARMNNKRSKMNEKIFYIFEKPQSD